MTEALPLPPGTRVTVISRSAAPWHGAGGLERHVGDLLTHLLDRGLHVTLVTRDGGTRAIPSCYDSPRFSVRWVPYRSFPFAGRRGTTILDRSTAYPLFGYRAGRVAAALSASGEAHMVYGHGASALGYALARRRDPGGTAPFVFNPHGLEEFGGLDASFGGHAGKRLGYAPLRAAVRTCAAAADRVIATDRVIAPAVEQHLHVAPDRIRVVPNAVDLRRVEQLAGPDAGARTRQQHGIGDRETVLLSVGRIEHNKGFHVLADALAALTDLPWRWVVVGDGSRRPHLEQQLRARGLADRVRLVGSQDDAGLHAWYEAATLFVHPTLYEGSSIVTLEAMAHRRAVVATTAGGLPDKVRPGETGWLVPPGDGRALADAIRAALGDLDRLPAMGRAGRALVEAEFSWPAATDRLLAVFAEVLSARARTSR